jgi:hypothetical protein
VAAGAAAAANRYRLPLNQAAPVAATDAAAARQIRESAL